MLDSATKKEIKHLINKLKFSDIEKFYSGNEKSLIGLEYERLSLDKITFENAKYNKLEKIIRHFCNLTSWELIYDENTVIGASSKNGSSISLEPGCQLEISLYPREDILSIYKETKKITELLDNIAKVYDVIFLGYGISPVSCVDNIELLNKRRYKVMDKYLPNCFYGELSQKMMRQTAGIQINIDYKDSKDAFYKLKFLNLIMPFMVGLCANSPCENNNLSDKQSLRANIWKYTGKERCNIFYKNIFGGFFAYKNIFKNYINSVLDVPMIFIERNNNIIELNGKINFREFMKNGIGEYGATIEDYLLHQSLIFPDIRLKNYIEIRNHDSSDLNMAIALCAFYKGLLRADIKKYMKKNNYLKISDIDKYMDNIIKFGLSYKINSKMDAWYIIEDLFNLAKNYLDSSEVIYLNPILNMINNKKTKADLIIQKNISKACEIYETLY